MADAIITAIIAAIPSAIAVGVVSYFFWRIQRKSVKREEEYEAKENARREDEERREAARQKNELMLIRSVNASISLGVATAKAVQRIPDAHCNGDMHAALEYAQQVKHEQKDFLAEQGIGAIYD